MGDVLRFPRGIRNNNAMNIRISSAPWLGKLSPNTDGSFEQFDIPEHGLRAGGIILVNYHKLDRLSTLRGYINRWAPPSENNTSAYLDAVCRSLDCDADDRYDVLDATRLADLASAIIFEEQGCSPYERDVIEAGIRMALSIRNKVA